MRCYAARALKSGNIHRCTSFPPINYQTGTNKTHRQHAECIKCFSCLLLNQLCNYLKDVLIVACSTLNISQRFSSSPSKIDWINQLELWGNRRPANQRRVCVLSVCVAGDLPVHERMCMFVRMWVYWCVCVCVNVLYIGLTAGLVQKTYWAFCLFGKQQAQSIWTGI